MLRKDMFVYVSGGKGSTSHLSMFVRTGRAKLKVLSGVLKMGEKFEIVNSFTVRENVDEDELRRSGSGGHILKIPLGQQLRHTHPPA